MALVVAWTAVVLVAAVALVRASLERRALERLVDLAERPEKLKRAVAALGHPHRPIVSAFMEGVHRSSTVDEALTRALVQAAQAPFAAITPVYIATVVASVGAALAPFVIALGTTAQQMASLFADARYQTARARYLSGAESLHPAFVGLGEACAQTAMITAALALAWALRWWLLRPEAREARLTKALIDCAGRMRPGAVAPAGTRLAELIAPERSLKGPVAAAVSWALATALGWGMLLGTADIRRSNREPKTFDVWPAEAERRIEVASALVLPRSDAGAPIARGERPSVTVGPREVAVHTVSVLKLKDGRPPARWKWPSKSIKRSLADFAAPREVLVLGHRDVELGTLVPVLRRLAEQHAVGRYHLVVERGLMTDRGPLPAQLSLEFRPPPSDVALKLSIQAHGVRVQDKTFVAFDEAGGWYRQLRGIVRASPAVAARMTDPIVIIQPGLDVTYGRLVDVLSAADGACALATECGLPGLGLRFIITTVYASP